MEKKNCRDCIHQSVLINDEPCISCLISNDHPYFEEQEAVDADIEAFVLDLGQAVAIICKKHSEVLFHTNITNRLVSFFRVMKDIKEGRAKNREMALKNKHLKMM